MVNPKTKISRLFHNELNEIIYSRFLLYLKKKEIKQKRNRKRKITVAAKKQKITAFFIAMK